MQFKLLTNTYICILFGLRFPTHHLLNVSLQIANKLGNLKKKKNLSFFFLLWLSGNESTITEATIDLLHQPLMMTDDDECAAIAGILCKGNRNTRIISAAVPFFSTINPT
jgi:hypothetical protein